MAGSPIGLLLVLTTASVTVTYTPITGTISTGVKATTIDTTVLNKEIFSSGTLKQITTGQTDSEVLSTLLDETITTTSTETNI